MRDLIDLVESLQSVEEKYTSNNKYFLHYMRDGDFDPWSNWGIICSWLFDNDYEEEVNAAITQQSGEHEPVTDGDELADNYDADLFSALPKDIQTQAAEYTIEWLMRHDPADAPTTAHMDLRKQKLLPRTTWLIHFSDNAEQIADNGFKYGQDQMDKLGLTTWFKDEAKKYGGYNFAFLASSVHGPSNYGSHAVLFQNSGVHCYHYGDNEDQIIFWGADVEPSTIVLIRKSDEWEVIARGLRDRVVYKSGDIDTVIQWTMKNFAQYRKALTGN
jgi:hypothetical protein